MEDELAFVPKCGIVRGQSQEKCCCFVVVKAWLEHSPPEGQADGRGSVGVGLDHSLTVVALLGRAILWYESRLYDFNAIALGIIRSS